MRLSKYPRFAAPSRALQRGSGSSQRSSGGSCVGFAGACPLISESSDIRSVRGVITHDARTARSSRLPYPRMTCARGPRRRLTGRQLAWPTRVGHPYHGFQLMKHHPHFRVLRATPGADRLTSRSHTLTEAGLQSLPQLHFLGCSLIGPACAAFAALHPAASFVSTSPATFEHDMSSASSLPLPHLRKLVPPSWTRRSKPNHAEGEAVYLCDARHRRAAPVGRCGCLLHSVLPLTACSGGYAGGEGVKGRVDAQETAARRRAHVAVNVGTVVPGNAGTDGEAESWEGIKLAINSQSDHTEQHPLQAVRHLVPTQDITWTLPEGGGGPKYTLT
ncbi:hypothetical protein DFH09DRAFT_1482460 [Mycena vulgaris]|nr:hypothetical protein DFH09DRAFT_1482460 [Mycena vulgaris]